MKNTVTKERKVMKENNRIGPLSIKKKKSTGNLLNATINSHTLKWKETEINHSKLTSLQFVYIFMLGSMASS